MKPFKPDSRGVSIVLVTLLIIIITVVATLLVYLWTIGIIGGLQGSGGQQIKDQLIMQGYDSQSASVWTLHLMNTGSVELIVSAVYVNGKPVTFSGVTSYPRGDEGSLLLNVSTLELDNGSTCLVKVVTSDGGVFPFSIVCGSRE
jgi:FlaG/FlaF family flagellin (archaellin)